ncbi:hypothetical protein OXYTRIMIC_354 [Oxytricha trifallax]|uniref:Uncharacterized protein n=1 Tax=Oxytricha trifallax TaxID=1172189 RepID=A0A073HZ74_9SPIT|nr:hypothetical protein OXYTRIMIC_354 [Oxytricha trifallax]
MASLFRRIQQQAIIPYYEDLFQPTYLLVWLKSYDFSLGDLLNSSSGEWLHGDAQLVRQQPSLMNKICSSLSKTPKHQSQY